MASVQEHYDDLLAAHYAWMLAATSSKPPPNDGPCSTRWTFARPAVRTIHGDVLDVLADLAPGSAEIVVCMGDTVLHLATKHAVISGTALGSAAESATWPWPSHY